MKKCKTYEVKIYIGLQEGYEGSMHNAKDIEKSLLEYCECGFCVTVTPLRFIYTGGKENGVLIGIINYPRFPKEESELDIHAFAIANKLMKEFKQYRCSIVFPDNTVLFENNELVGDEGDK